MNDQKVIPPDPKPGQRFMRDTGYGTWTVCDTFEDICPCHDPLPYPSCHQCKGTGRYLQCEEIAEHFSEADARLLVFGAELRDKLRRAEAEVARLQDIIEGLGDRVAKQSELLSRAAERP